MTLKEKIQAEIKKAMKEREEIRVSTLRMLLSAVLNREKEKRSKLSREEKDTVRLEELSKLNEEEFLEVIAGEAKKRKDSIEQFSKGGRDDLVKKEKEELDILIKYLPEQMTEEEIRKIVKEKIQELGVSGRQEAGKLMGELMPALKGRAEGGLVNKIVQEELK